MNWRAVPLIPTLLVLAACFYMVHLGFWQLDRLHQKQERIARAELALKTRESVSIGVVWREKDSDAFDYRRTAFWCRQVLSSGMVAGRNAAGQAGWVQVANCLTAPVATETFQPTEPPHGVPAQVVLGWTRRPAPLPWAGGEVRGWVVPGGESRHHVLADPPLAGLAANASPDPRDLPNNHLSYAVQWFLFAATALVIYALALWKRVKD